MYLSKAASVVSFVGALVIGVAASAWFMEIPTAPTALDVPLPISIASDPHGIAPPPVPVVAENLLGRWKGAWKYSLDGGGKCTIDIDRVDGDKFYGTVYQGGGEFAFKGNFVVDGRRVFFHVIKVIKPGHYSQLDLGRYGSFSDDGRSLLGSGRDGWGDYDWDVTKVESGE